MPVCISGRLKFIAITYLEIWGGGGVGGICTPIYPLCKSCSGSLVVKDTEQVYIHVVVVVVEVSRMCTARASVGK